MKYRHRANIARVILQIAVERRPRQQGLRRLIVAGAVHRLLDRLAVHVDGVAPVVTDLVPERVVEDREQPRLQVGAALELLRGVRDEQATRELIVRENRKYARRQLLWFRKEPNLQWINAAGEREDTEEQVANALSSACGPSAVTE